MEQIIAELIAHVENLLSSKDRSEMEAYVKRSESRIASLRSNLGSFKGTPFEKFVPNLEQIFDLLPKMIDEFFPEPRSPRPSGTPGILGFVESAMKLKVGRTSNELGYQVEDSEFWIAWAQASGIQYLIVDENWSYTTYDALTGEIGKEVAIGGIGEIYSQLRKGILNFDIELNAETKNFEKRLKEFLGGDTSDTKFRKVVFHTPYVSPPTPAPTKPKRSRKKADPTPVDPTFKYLVFNAIKDLDCEPPDNPDDLKKPHVCDNNVSKLREYLEKNTTFFDDLRHLEGRQLYSAQHKKLKKYYEALEAEGSVFIHEVDVVVRGKPTKKKYAFLDPSQVANPAKYEALKGLKTT